MKIFKVWSLGIGILLSAIPVSVNAQKKPLDHSVYDSWQHIGENLISNDGNWIVYTVDPQEGDNELVIQSADTKYKKTIPRGYNALITEDSRYVVFKIKPFYKDTREAKIKKKKPDDMPKDSLGIMELGKDKVYKTTRVKSFKSPQKGIDWVAYQLEKTAEPPGRTKPGESPVNKKLADSLNRVIDSLQRIIEEQLRSEEKNKHKNKDEDVETHEYASTRPADADGDDTTPGQADTGSDLVVRRLSNGEEKTFPNVLEYYWNKQGDKILIEQAKNPKDSASKPMVSIFDTRQNKVYTISRGGNDFKNFSFSEDGKQLAFLAERDARPKELQKYYKVWYFSDGMDTAALLIDKGTVDMKLGMGISEHGNLNFSRNGKRLFFGVAPIPPVRDTTLVEMDYPKLDIWHYNDDYLQTVQNYPLRLRAAQQENFMAVFNLHDKSINRLGSKEIPQVIPTNEGDGDQFIGVTDFGKRVESQWLGNTLKDIYAIDVNTGERKLVKKDLYGQVYPSSTGRYIAWYDRRAKNYFSWDGDSTRNITGKIKFPLWNESSEVPDEPGNYGLVKWEENDKHILLYDKYGIWKVDPSGKETPLLLATGREKKISYRYLQTDPEERFIKPGQTVYFRTFNEDNKYAGLWSAVYNGAAFTASSVKPVQPDVPFVFGAVTKAKNADRFIFTQESFEQSPVLYTWTDNNKVQLATTNPQQANYNWGSAELFKWKAYNGKEATGIVYKPEDFDPKKKYPMIVYFYETLSDALYDYKEPAPIRSAINIPFFVSRGYIIFLPDIHYTTGHPGKNAYDYIVSGSRALVKKGFVDSTRMGLQGHSWGGYQAAQLATMTKLFKAIWAGAPVANMTSAYGGIRWESGISRQFQYEKTQSRIGATLWEKPNLYIENSPLFHLDKVTAPMVIMANDADGAVPWYQGIELFTALRRLGKKVWMFNYNGQGHGLTQRQDMRDYQIRMQQWFDWMLKGEKPARWIVEGIPAVKKGKDWGLEIVE